MPQLPTSEITPQKKLFHNEWVNVYPMTLALDEITFWKENNRTIFTFERLRRIEGKELTQIPLKEITKFVAEQDIHKLQTLAESIGRNGVQVPLIIRDDGKLLDGNRRFFACHWLRANTKSEPSTLKEIPVYVIREKDLSDTLELKILAEANFIPDLKVSWPLDAQARAVDDYYRQYKTEKKADRETALAEVTSVFGISRKRAIDLLDTLQLTKEFIKEGSTADEKIKRREIVEEKFVYLWEFRNKAMRGSGALDVGTELPEVRELFFQFMARGSDNPIKNVKQVEPLIQARRDSNAWSILKESKGSKLPMVVSIINDKKELRRAEDRIRVFLSWLKEATELPPKAKGLLREVAKLAAERANE